MKKSKLALLQSVVALILCVSMLLGSTWAWFTDTVESTNNIIQSGTLNAEMYWTKDLNTSEDDWANAATGAIFDYGHWEPGYTDIKYVKVTNEGSLAFRYCLNIIPEVMPTAGAINLSDVIDVYVIENPTANLTRTDLADMTPVGTLTDLITDPEGAANGILLPTDTDAKVTLNEEDKAIAKEGTTTYCIALKMQETAGNEYQDKTVGGSFRVQLLATQYTYENDSFGNDYDADSEWPVPGLKENVTGSTTVTATDGKVSTEATIETSTDVSATIPAGVAVNDGVSELTLSVSEKTTSESNITAGETEELMALDVHVEGVSADNTTPIIVNLGAILPVGLNSGNVTLYHVENGVTNTMTQVATLAELDAHNEFYYDPATGITCVAMATFSEVTVVADTENAWNGTIATTWYNTTDTSFTIANADQLAGFGAIVGGMAKDSDGKAIAQDSFSGKTVTLISDINLGDKNNASESLIFHPIGYYYTDDKDADGTTGDYYSTVYSFEGTFDGNGHTIANFYQNTWEIKGDYDGNYYKDGMGLFGYVVGGTVKNLTVDNFSSDGEFTPTGVIAAYACNSTFENIAITNCNPRVYNTGNGGIVGIGGNTSDTEDAKLTFTNITIDNTNIISALWGSWDVACGGLVGMFRGAGHVYMTNCHVAAQIDVYNDVCGNYQYYWYRYSGMMIGTNKNMTTDANGYTVPETDKFYAKDCTVHFGDWNDYYYCELVANTLASYTHDHQFSRLTQISSLDEIKSGDTWIKTGNYLLISGETKTCYHIVNKDGTLTQHLHTEAGYEDSIDEDGDGNVDLKEDKQIVYLPFNQLFTGYGWGVKHIPVYNGDDYAFEGIKILDREVADSVEKFETKFTNTNYTYRVGNAAGSTVSLGSLFAAKDGVTINNSGVYVTIDKVYDDNNVSGVFTANTTDWTKGTIQFSGTGMVTITIQDYNFCEPTELTVLVVDAVNATTATSATANNVVLLNDCGFSSLEVSDGYALYGNGFTMTCSSDSVALDMGYAFVTLSDGTLDNVQIVCPNFDYAALYKSNLTSNNNRSETDSSGKTRYYNAKSGVLATGNSQILNSRISGGRAALYASSGNIVVDNSRLELGAVATVIISGANSFVFRDTTLVQKPTASTYDSTKTLMGMSVLYLCDTDGNATPTTLEGSFVQYAWVDESCIDYMPTGTDSIASTVLAKEGYQHTVDGKTCVNLGFAYMPNEGTTVNKPSNITDSRTEYETIPYGYESVTASVPVSGVGVNVNISTYVYSYKSTNGTADSFKTVDDYVPNRYSDIITVTYSDTTEGLTSGKTYGTDGWVYELNVDLDTASGYALDFSKLSMTVNGVTATDYKVNGSDKPTEPVTVTAGGTTYTLTATVNGSEYDARFKVTGTETSKESPSLVATNYEDGLCVASSYGGTWHGAAPVLEGIQIKYWSVAEKQYKTITLSDYTPTTAGKQNGTNAEWTYSPENGDFTLTIKNETAVHSSNNIYAMPVVCDSKLYFVASSSNGLVNTGNTARTIKINYYFKDNNGGEELSWNHTWSVEENKDAQYKYSDFCDGTLTKLDSSSGGECLVEGTLITMADGTQKAVEDLVVGDMILVFNHITGELEAAPLIFNTHESEEAKLYNVLHLQFSNGEDVGVIESHGFFDVTLMKYVYINYDNYTDYIGHSFYTLDGEVVELTSAYVAEELTRIFCPVTYFHMNSFANGMLNTPNIPGDITGLVNYFEYDPDLKYNEEAMQRDIETYGLYTYADFSDYISEAAYNSSPAVHLKVAVGKGMITYEEIIAVIQYLLAGSLID